EDLPLKPRRLHGNRLSGAARAWLEGCCEWADVTAPKKIQARPQPHHLTSIINFLDQKQVSASFSKLPTGAAEAPSAGSASNLRRRCEKQPIEESRRSERRAGRVQSARLSRQCHKRRLLPIKPTLTARVIQSDRRSSDRTKRNNRAKASPPHRRQLFNPGKMKAISPVRSFRKAGTNFSEHSMGISRSKTPVDDPLSLLYNMNDCYSKLKELVPSIPQNKNVSKMEILQHVIDYILDLQIALDSSLHHPAARPGQSASRTPLTTLNTDISILSLQVITRQLTKL
ncbi:hypothetical protein XENOCAPTIV_021010, partial [Xenoophorus captivus]